jgi:hypothetical protein
MGLNARAFFEKHLDRPLATRRFNELIGSCVLSDG